jgi:beta-glucanase (GH16 family)
VKALILSAVIATFSGACFADALNQDTKVAISDKNKASAPLYGAELYSHETILFGRFTIRMKMVSEPGVVSSFFTYDNQSWQGEGRPWREIDFETIGSHPDILQTNLITGTQSERVHSERTSEIANIEDYHTYTLEWTPEAIAWFVDDQEARRDTAEESQQVRDMTDTPQTYRSNVWISEVIAWVGQFDESSLPLYQVIDWIQYESLEEDGTYKVQWRDDFDKFDNSRWGRGNWGFDTNMVTFAPENLKVIDGELVFALTLGKKGIDLEQYRSKH